MLSHNDIHYLTGLLILASMPESTRVVLGDLVADETLDHPREVDVTATFVDLSGAKHGVGGYEVKDHAEKLDVTHVEQLVQKLNDLPDLSTRSIVSASGYTPNAIKKANAHGIELLDIVEWSPSTHTGTNWPGLANFILEDDYVLWIDGPHSRLQAEEGTSEELLSENWKDWDVVNQDGQGFPNITTVQSMVDRLVRASTANLKKQDGYSNLEDGAVIEFAWKNPLLDRPRGVCDHREIVFVAIEIAGRLQLVRKSVKGKLMVLAKHKDRTPYVGCALAESTDGSLIGITFVESTRTISATIVSKTAREKSLVRARHELKKLDSEDRH